MVTDEVTVWRPSAKAVTGAGGNVSIWGDPLATAVPMTIEMLTEGRAFRIYGQDTVVDYRGWCDRGVSLQSGDVLKVTAGNLEGTYLLVKTPPTRRGESDRLEMALAKSHLRPDAS